MAGDGQARERRDFFVSYTKADRQWAEWIAWQLEDAGYTTMVQAWDMVPGANWLRMMDQATRSAEHTIAVLSAEYLENSAFGEVEWLAAFRRDPSSTAGRLIPIRVEDCDIDGMLAGIVYADLFDLSGEDAIRDRLLTAVQAALKGRAKPLVQPPLVAIALSIGDWASLPLHTLVGFAPDGLLILYDASLQHSD